MNINLNAYNNLEFSFFEDVSSNDVIFIFKNNMSRIPRLHNEEGLKVSIPKKNEINAVAFLDVSVILEKTSLNLEKILSIVRHWNSICLSKVVRSNKEIFFSNCTIESANYYWPDSFFKHQPFEFNNIDLSSHHSLEYDLKKIKDFLDVSLIELWNFLARKDKNQIERLINYGFCCLNENLIIYEKFITFLFIGTFILDYYENLNDIKAIEVDVSNFEVLNEHFLDNSHRKKTFFNLMDECKDADRSILKIYFKGKALKYFSIFAEPNYSFGLFCPKYKDSSDILSVDIPAFPVLVNSIKARYGTNAVLPMPMIGFASLHKLYELHKINFHPLACSMPGSLDLNEYDKNIPSGRYGALIHDLYHLKHLNEVPKSHRIFFISLAEYLLDHHNQFQSYEDLSKIVQKVLEIENAYMVLSAAFDFYRDQRIKSENLEEKDKLFSYGFASENDYMECAVYFMREIFKEIEEKSNIDKDSIMNHLQTYFSGNITVEEDSQFVSNVSFNFDLFEEILKGKSLHKAKSIDYYNDDNYF